MSPEDPDDQRDTDQAANADETPPRNDDSQGDEARLWALPPARRALHWAVIPLLLAILAFAGVRDIMRTGPWTLGWMFVLVPLLLITQQLRAVVAVWLDPTHGELILFRAAGGALRTRLRQVRRLDHGAAFGRYSARRRRPIRIVTDHGAATLSVFFPDPYGLATTLRDANPDTHIDL